MASFNKVILIGNLTRDPELRYTQSGKAVARLGLAINHKYTRANGEKCEEVTFVDVDAWDKQAETLGQYMKKGRAIMIEGRLKLDSWEDKQTGQKRSKLGVMMTSFCFLGDRGSDQPKQDNMAKQDNMDGMVPRQTTSPIADEDVPGSAVNNDDVPF